MYLSSFDPYIVKRNVSFDETGLINGYPHNLFRRSSVQAVSNVINIKILISGIHGNTRHSSKEDEPRL